MLKAATGAWSPGIPRLGGFRGMLGPFANFAAVALLVLTISRVGLIVAYHDRLPEPGGVMSLLIMGLRFDVVVVAALGFLPVAAQLLTPQEWLRSVGWKRLWTIWFTTWVLVLTFNEAATPAFMAEFGVRPNRQYVEYLGTPGVVFSTIWEANRASLLIGIGLAVAAAYLTRGRLRDLPVITNVPDPWVRVLVLLPLLVGLGYAARGSLGHRPLSASNAALSTDATVNDLALNSTYSAAYAIRQMWREREGLRGYGHIAEDEALRRVRTAMQLPASAFTMPGNSTAHVLVPSVQLALKPNLVILLQESLGAQYFASLGGEPVARKLEEWRGRSFWFDNLYATGTRSARGIEAVVTGFLPTRTSSAIKLEGAQAKFFTIARALKEQGYRTDFIYGGDASFDNMRRFFLNNGFDNVIDQRDLEPEARFTTTWGVSDEDLYDRVDQVVASHYRDGQPFFTLVFSTSNHPPYDFPDGRIELVEQPRLTPRNAARYADFAVGSYLDKAARSAYWSSTVFSVMADHGNKSLDSRLVPINSFHIPAFITGGPVQPRIVGRLASQIDLLPTTLSLMGLTLTLPATGIDQSRLDLEGPGHAVMQFNDSAAYRVGDRLNVFIPHEPARQFLITGTDLVPVPVDAEFALDALAQSQVPIQAYRDFSYR